MAERHSGGEYKPRLDKESVFYESRLERYSKRYHQFLKVLFVAWNVAYLDHDDILLAAERLPQIISAKLSEGDAKHIAEGLLEKYQEKMDKGEPLPVDLASLYLEQERQLGGVSEENIVKARGSFDALVEAAKRQQTGGWSEPETLGWILKQQGDYNDGYNQLTDLLNSGVGECEARVKYIAAMVQAVFPEYVKNGQMKIEVFRSKVNENGVVQPGHVRVIIDLTKEGKGVIVLEGDAAHYEMNPVDIAKHKEIGGHEVTAMAVKSFAVKTSLTTWGVENEPNKKLLKQATREDLKKIAELKNPVGQLSSFVHTALVDNSTSSYPAGTASYGDGRETMNIDPHPIGKSYALSRENFGHTIELRLVHNKPKLTLENFETAFHDGITDLSIFGALDEHALDAVLAHRQSRRASLITADSRTNRSSQMKRFDALHAAKYLPIALGHRTEILTTIFKQNGPIAWTIKGNDLPPIFGIPTSAMDLQNVTRIPDSIAGIDWTEDSYLDLNLATIDLDDHDIEGGEALLAAVRKGLDHVSIFSGMTADQHIANLDFTGVTLQSLKLGNVSVGSLAGLNVDQLSWSRYMSFQAGALAGVKARNTILRFESNGADQASNNPKDVNEFDGSIFFDSGEGGKGIFNRFVTDTLSLQVTKDKTITIEGAAFSNMHFKVLSLSSDFRLNDYAFAGAKIDTLVVRVGHTAPADMMQLIQSRSQGSSLNDNIKRVVIIKTQGSMLNRADQRFLTRTPPFTSDELIAYKEELNRNQLISFRQRLHADTPVHVIIDQDYQLLIDKYGSEEAIPSGALFTSSYLFYNGEYGEH